MTSAPRAEDLARNVRLYPVFSAATSVLPWMPVFFLYFIERVGFDDALLLGAIYYATVVLVEVPSGYLSDRLGRRPTLMIACASLLAAYIAFIAASGVADSFAWLLMGEMLLACGIACQSGSDSALLYDSLDTIGAAADYEAAEARAKTASMSALAASCLAGGVLGSVSLVYAYVLAALAAGISLWLAWRFVEPVGQAPEASEAPAVPSAQATQATQATQTAQATQAAPSQLIFIARHLRDPLLVWLLVWQVLAFTLAHIPYEFYQPWIGLLGEQGGVAAWLDKESVPLVSGVTIALSMAGGAIGAASSVALGRALGLSGLLLAANLAQVAIIGGLAIALHPVLLVLVICRNLGMAATWAPTMAAIAPRIGSAQRATWLSLQSLVGRLGFAIVLFVIARAIDGSSGSSASSASSATNGASGTSGEFSVAAGTAGGSLDWSTLSGLLWVLALAGLGLSIVVWFTGRRLAR